MFRIQTQRSVYVSIQDQLQEQRRVLCRVQERTTAHRRLQERPTTQLRIMEQRVMQIRLTRKAMAQSIHVGKQLWAQLDFREHMTV